MRRLFITGRLPDTHITATIDVTVDDCTLIELLHDNELCRGLVLDMLYSDKITSDDFSLILTKQEYDRVKERLHNFGLGDV